MTTITIKLPEKQAKRLKKVDLGYFFKQCAEDYIEHEQDKRLRKAISKSSKIDKLARALEKKL